MKHTFLFEESTWQASGFMIEESGIQFAVEGAATITHDKNIWVNDGWMRVLSDPPIEFRNIYEIKPFTKTNYTTDWTSQNPVLGKLIGHFIIVDDSILSSYISESNDFHGIEYLKQMNKDFYLNRGALMKTNKMISSWSVELRRTK